MYYYVHNVPGRLRVKIPMIRKDPERGEQVEALLENLDGVDSVVLNGVTGSVVIYYDAERLEAGEILDRLKEHGYFDESRAMHSDDYLKSAFETAGGAVGRVLFGWAVGKAFEGSSLAFLTVLI
ncbi:MAG TPA: cation transporter [Desulfobacterales bacterium]|nr:cation transporter [Desulfobacterales bacterium]